MKPSIIVLCFAALFAVIATPVYGILNETQLKEGNDAYNNPKSLNGTIDLFLVSGASQAEIDNVKELLSGNLDTLQSLWDDANDEQRNLLDAKVVVVKRVLDRANKLTAKAPAVTAPAPAPAPVVIPAPTVPQETVIKAVIDEKEQVSNRPPLGYPPSLKSQLEPAPKGEQDQYDERNRQKDASYHSEDQSFGNVYQTEERLSSVEQAILKAQYGKTDCEKHPLVAYEKLAQYPQTPPLDTGAIVVCVDGYWYCWNYYSPGWYRLLDAYGSVRP